MLELHPQLEKDSFGIGRFTLCRLLLMNESRYPWFILVPERINVTEIYQLPEADQQVLWRESALLARSLAQEFAADKMNIAAIGNIVPQSHIHHVVRYKTDAAWPAPVWGKFAPAPYDDAGLQAVIARLKNGLPEDFIWGIS